MNLTEILEDLFNDAFDAGEDIVLERQFDNDPEAYMRYRARHTKHAQAKIEALLPEKYPPEELPFDENTYEHGVNNTIDDITKRFKGESR